LIDVTAAQIELTEDQKEYQRRFPGITQAHLEERANFNLAEHMAKLATAGVAVSAAPLGKLYPCGCVATGAPADQLPADCPTHGKPKGKR
jgi:hypothetical protein